MIVLIPPAVDGPLCLAALGTLLTLGLGHVIMLPGIFFHTTLSRPQAYIFGASIVLVFFTALYLLARDPVLTPLQPILDIWFLFAAGAIPTLGFRLMRDHLHLRDGADNANKSA